jgi:putative transposase
VQRKYSKHKGKRTKHKLAILHEKVANQRKDFLHKTSSELIKNHDSLAIEDLAVSNMVKNHKLAQSISDAGWSTFVTMLEYKAEWHGKNILKIGRFEPSSKLHANCGYTNKDLTLKDREWTCPKCGEVVSRDLNAAINIKSFALKNILSGTDRKNQGKLPTLVGALTLEAHPIACGVGG